MRFALSSLVCLVLLGCARDDGAPPDVTFSSSLARLTNVATFAESPRGRTYMISTYDRTGGNTDWGSWGEVRPDGTVDIADIKGPGCITRIWVTSVPASEWLFYFDGETEPRIRKSKDEMFRGPEPFISPICGQVSGGRYSYLPIPFAKSLRIAIAVPPHKPSMRPYYHINYEQFPPGTVVESYPVQMSPSERQLVDDVAAAWSRNAETLKEAAADCGNRSTHALKSGGRIVWIDDKRAGAIRTFSIKLTPPAGTSALSRARLLREVVLSFFWDGASMPSVDVPLGDFFCNGLRWREFSSLALGNVDGTFVCRFPMPFSSSARAELRNDGPTDVTVETAFDIGPSDLSGSTCFHAGWNSATSRGIPHRVLSVDGAGHFLGCYLTAIGMDGTWTILEGDESIRVDGETSPSWHGTGLEDYFNGAWYYTGIFDLPLHGLLEKAPIRTDQYRMQLLDRVKFNQGVKVNFEFGDGNRARGYMSSTAYWYQDGPSPTGNTIPPAARRFPPQDPLEPHAIMGHLFELERIGYLAEARERCLIYAQKFGSAPMAPVIKLRAAAYGEKLSGIEALRDTYESVAKAGPGTQTGKEAGSLLWFHESNTNALLGVHANAAYELYLDGKLISKGDNPKALTVSRTGLDAGEHELTAKVTPSRPDSWFAMYLRTHTVDVRSDITWEYTSKRPGSWPKSGGGDWNSIESMSNGDMLPRMNSWQFAPNAFINMQSGRKSLLRPWRTWKQPPGSFSAYLKKSFTIPAKETPDES